MTPVNNLHNLLIASLYWLLT